MNDLKAGPVTSRVLATAIAGGNPRAHLADVLRAAIEMVSLPDNDFTWSYWRDQEHAVADIAPELERLETGALPSHHAVAMLFVPTGAMQEVATSSGWGDVFCALGDRYDALSPQIWGKPCRALRGSGPQVLWPPCCCRL